MDFTLSIVLFLSRMFWKRSDKLQIFLAKSLTYNTENERFQEFFFLFVFL